MIDNEKYDRAIGQMNKQFKKSGIKFEDVRKHKCDRCGFFVLDIKTLTEEWCKDHRIYEDLCKDCVEGK